MTRKIPKPNQERYRYRSGCGFFNYRLHHLVCYLKYNCLKLHLCVLFLTVFKRKWQKLHKKLASYQILSIVPLCGDAGWSSLVARRAHRSLVQIRPPQPIHNIRSKLKFIDSVAGWSSLVSFRTRGGAAW